MDKHSVSSFQIKEYQVDNIEFRINKNFVPQERVTVSYDIDSDISIEDLEQRISKVVLKCIIFKNAKKTNKPFTLKISVSGLFQFTGDVPEEQLRSFSEVSATAVLFPFLRAAITNISVACNQPPLILPLINVYEFIRKKKEKNTRNTKPEKSV